MSKKLGGQLRSWRQLNTSKIEKNASLVKSWMYPIYSTGILSCENSPYSDARDFGSASIQQPSPCCDARGC
ncbi:hypothetical protein Pta6605_49130 [Pseudomonas amygdali pv. tabaci]|nr:hypothetical protein Pta6605_49130 [Pseudomonas amygdali pv. tabaci]